MQREASKRLKPQGSEYRGGAQGRSSSEEGGRFCNGTGPKGLQCSAATQSQPVAGGALWPRQSRFPSRMGMAEHREPYDARVSRTVLGARGGETPPRDSPGMPADQGKEALALAGRRPGWLRARRLGPEPARQEGRQTPASQAAEAADPRASCDDHGQAGQLQRRKGRGDALGRASEAQRLEQQSGELPSADAATRATDEALQV